MKKFKEIIESLVYCNTDKCYACHYNNEEFPNCCRTLENDMNNLNKLIEKLMDVELDED